MDCKPCKYWSSFQTEMVHPSGREPGETGQNCTTLLKCTKTSFNEGAKLHDDNFALVKILHGGSFFHESKKKLKKIKTRNRKKN